MRGSMFTADCIADASDLFRPRLFSKWICVFVVAIGVHQQRKHRVSSAWSVDIALSSILPILWCEVRMIGMFMAYIYFVIHALEAKWRNRRGRPGQEIFKPTLHDRGDLCVGTWAIAAPFFFLVHNWPHRCFAVLRCASPD